MRCVGDKGNPEGSLFISALISSGLNKLACNAGCYLCSSGLLSEAL